MRAAQAASLVWLPLGEGMRGSQAQDAGVLHDPKQSDAESIPQIVHRSIGADGWELLRALPPRRCESRSPLDASSQPINMFSAKLWNKLLLPDANTTTMLDLVPWWGPNVMEMGQEYFD